ncbi:hypothetical protein ABMA27_002379 [Loxostege sticticalis]|uniref:PHD and RING finger domain-containing protein 1 n=1 Tax=Loxostege sticticalis TaxID=481309 RepID=A0ABR3HTF4_LOXSC
MSDDGSEDSAPRPKRKIKRVVVMSSNSSSDSDESIAPTATRRKRMRVISDVESDSSGSSVVCAGTRRKRTLPKLRDSDGDSDSSGWGTDHSDAPKPGPVPAKPASGFASDSSEGNSDKCSICLMRFTTQEVGTPQNCEHIFCLDCITEWSKNVNTCPVDRITFDSIVVRACAGGRVLRTEPVKVVERRPSVDMLVVEDPTVCEICGSSDNEDSMLLCDGCDLGFHMQCLTPPLTEIPADQWLCPNCDNILDVIHLSEVEDLFSGLVDIDLPLLPRPTPLREPRNVRRSSRNISLDEPSTSSGRRGGSSNVDAAPSTSRGTRTSRRTGSSTGTTRRRTIGTQRRKYKRRRTKTVIIEYEVEENGKFPITKRVKRRVTKRRTKKRQPRTAARRSHVRASVRAKLANLSSEPQVERSQLANTSGGVQALSISRRRAGIPALSLFGARDQLDYFEEDDEHGVSEGATTAVAVRPTASILSAYRQARRKMVTIPSPPHASSAPDLLSSILDSQSKLHSKNSVVSIAVDGSVNIKVQTRSEDKSLNKAVDNKKLDLTKGEEEATRKAPSYPGQSRGGGWGGGYRGSYPRDQPGGFGRSGYQPDHAYQGGYGYQGRPGQQGAPQNNSFGNSMRRDEPESFGNFPRRQYPYPQNDDNNFDRNRRPPQNDANRAQNFPHNQRQDEQRRHSLGPAWQPYGGPAPRRDAAPLRHSFGGSDNPLDMRMGQIPPQNARSAHPAPDAFPRAETHEEPQPYRPLPQPPVFKFDKTPEVEKSEDERSDSGLVIDTEKYDPTEPTNDDDSGEDTANAAEVASSGTPDVPAVSPSVASVPAVANASVDPPLPRSQSVVQNIIAGIDTGALNVPANVLDSAVRQVLQEHRNLITPAHAPRQRDRSDDDSDGDCPNFSIYSATSVHIANDTGGLVDEPKVQPSDDMADLVQEDDETPPPEAASPSDDVDRTPDVTPVKNYGYDSSVKRKTEEELKEKVSKRCPITTNPRNPIKIKLNTPSLIKRHMALYDNEEPADDAEPANKVDSSDESPKKNLSDKERADGTGDSLPEKPKVNKIEPTENVNSAEDKEITKDPDEKTESPKEKEPIEEPVPVEPSEVPDSKVASDEEDEDEDDNKDDEKSPQITNTEEENDEKKIEEDDEKESEKRDDSSVSDKDEKLEDDARSDDGNDDISDEELPQTRDEANNDEALEKMTESISETEDERSYTPCLDENKSKDTSLEPDKDKGIEGLDTEMISEDEGNEMFSDDERQRSPSPSPAAARSPSRSPSPAPAAPEDGEILDKRRDKPERDDGPRKKKRKDSKRDAKKDGKEKSKKSKRSDVTFKKLSKSGKERNYRDKDRDRDKEERPRRESSAERKRKRKEKRKDLERYDVRTVVTEKRRRVKDPFGRDVSPRRSRSPSLDRSPPPERSPAAPRAKRTRTRSRSRESRARRTLSRPRRSPSMPRVRRSVSPIRPRRSVSPVRRRRTKSPSRIRRTPSPARRSPSPVRVRRSPTPRRASPSPRRRVSSSPPVRRARASVSPRSPSPRRRRRSGSRARRRRSGSRARKRRASGSASGERAKSKGKRRRRARSERPTRRRSPKRRRARRRSAAREPPMQGTPGGSVDSRLLSPRTPPPERAPPTPHAPHTPRRRRERVRRAPRAGQGASKEVFTSGDNILVSVSFKDQDRPRADSSPLRRERREKRRERRRRRKADAEAEAARPVAIIDLERSPFRELTPSPRNVIVLSDSDHGGNEAAPKEREKPSEPAPAASGPRTPPAPPVTERQADTHPPEKGHRAAAAPADAPAEAGSEPAPRSPDAYDPFEPTRSPSASPSRSRSPSPPPPATPPRATMTLEAAQKTNLSADDVIDRRPLSPMEKVSVAPCEPTRSPSASPSRSRSPSPPPPATPPRATMTLEAAQKTNLSADDVIDRRPLSPMEKVSVAPCEPTRSPSASPSRSRSPSPPPPATPPRATMTLEAAQKTNLSADDVIDRRPLSPMEKVSVAPCEPTRSPSASPSRSRSPSPPPPATPPRATMTLEAAQKTNLSADDVIDRRPLSPMEKVSVAPCEPTRSPSASPSRSRSPSPPPPATPPRATMTLEAAQKTNLSADDVIDRRPLSPMEKVSVAPCEPTRSPSASPSRSRSPSPPPPATPPRATMTLEAAQKTNLSADDVIDRRPLSPMEKVSVAPCEPTRSPSASPSRSRSPSPPPPATPPRATMTLEAAQKTNLSADDVIDRRPLSPMEKVSVAPCEPTRSPSASPSRSRSPSPPPPATPPRATMTLEAAQKTNLSADDVIDRRPLSPMEKVMALLQSTRDVSPEPPPPDAVNPPAAASPPLAAPAAPAPAPAPRIVLPEAPRPPPKLFLAKPSPIKSDPIKPMQARPVRRADSDAGGGGGGGGGESPYSPGSSDFGELFEPPAPAPRHKRDIFDALVDKHARPRKSHAAKVPVKLNKKKGKTQVGVKIDEDNLKILDDLPSSAVEMQVKSKFLKKLNRQERVVEEVKLVLKPHYNKKRVTKDEYKDILRRAVPKICHNKSGEINPTKIQALVEAYVKKFRKKHKLGLA